MNDNTELPTAALLWVELALCNQRIAEETVKVAEIMKKLMQTVTGEEE